MMLWIAFFLMWYDSALDHLSCYRICVSKNMARENSRLIIGCSIHTYICKDVVDFGL